MKCQFCDQQATVHLTDLVNDQEMHLCSRCAKEDNGTGQEKWGAAALIGVILSKALQSEAEDQPGLACPACGLTFAEFRSTGRFGCPNDYEAFAEQLAPLMERFQSGASHRGKRPRTGGTARSLSEMHRQLHQAVTLENYEQAAQLRDLIRQEEAGS